MNMKYFYHCSDPSLASADVTHLLQVLLESVLLLVNLNGNLKNLSPLMF